MDDFYFLKALHTNTHTHTHTHTHTISKKLSKEVIYKFLF